MFLIFYYWLPSPCASLVLIVCFFFQFSLDSAMIHFCFFSPDSKFHLMVKFRPISLSLSLSLSLCFISKFRKRVIDFFPFPKGRRPRFFSSSFIFYWPVWFWSLAPFVIDGAFRWPFRWLRWPRGVRFGVRLFVCFFVSFFLSFHCLHIFSLLFLFLIFFPFFFVCFCRRLSRCNPADVESWRQLGKTR